MRHEDRADDRRDHLRGNFRDLGQYVAHEMYPASLPCRTLERDLDRTDQAGMRVADHQLHPGQAPAFEVAEELCPEWFGLGVSYLEAEYLPSAVCGNPDRDHDRLRHDATSDAGFAIGRVDEHVRVARVVQAALPELGDVFVEIGADA